MELGQKCCPVLKNISQFEFSIIGPSEIGRNFLSCRPHPLLMWNLKIF